MKTRQILHIPTGKIDVYTIPEICNLINADRGQQWIDYDQHDWVEGWHEWMAEENQTTYKLLTKAEEMSKTITNIDLIESLSTLTNCIDGIPVMERAEEEYDLDAFQMYDGAIIVENQDQTISFEIVVYLGLIHVRDSGDWLTPPSHEITISESEIFSADVWIGEEKYNLPITKKVSNIMFNLLDLQECRK